jgi:hypothetical protein
MAHDEKDGQEGAGGRITYKSKIGHAESHGDPMASSSQGYSPAHRGQSAEAKARVYLDRSRNGHPEEPYRLV